MVTHAGFPFSEFVMYLWDVLVCVNVPGVILHLLNLT